MDGRGCGVDYPRLVPAHAARACLRQRQPVYPDPGNRPQRAAGPGHARLLAALLLWHARRRAGLGTRPLGQPRRLAAADSPAVRPRARPAGRARTGSTDPGIAAATWRTTGPAQGPVDTMGRRAAANLPRCAGRQAGRRPQDAGPLLRTLVRQTLCLGRRRAAGGARPRHRLHPSDPCGHGRSLEGRATRAPGPQRHAELAATTAGPG
ncbi:hypothetical protein D9M71_515720 [compost metagenome]